MGTLIGRNFCSAPIDGTMIEVMMNFRVQSNVESKSRWEPTVPDMAYTKLWLCLTRIKSGRNGEVRADSVYFGTETNCITGNLRPSRPLSLQNKPKEHQTTWLGAPQSRCRGGGIPVKANKASINRMQSQKMLVSLQYGFIVTSR